MSNDIQKFHNTEFGELGVIVIDGKEMFPATDCARMLGYVKPHDAIDRHCRYSVKYGVPHPQSENKTIEMNFIPESDLYRLIISSTLPAAEKFERWVFNEVLPSIRKIGSYNPFGQFQAIIPSTIVEALRLAANLEEQRAALEAKVEAAAPKVLFADSVSASYTDILIGDLAKFLRQNGYDIGQNRLFQYLRDTGYLMKNGASKNMPTQRSMDQCLFRVKESTVNMPDGTIRITKTTKVTGKGQIFFINHFLKEKKILCA